MARKPQRRRGNAAPRPASFARALARRSATRLRGNDPARASGRIRSPISRGRFRGGAAMTAVLFWFLGGFNTPR